MSDDNPKAPPTPPVPIPSWDATTPESEAIGAPAAAWGASAFEPPADTAAATTAISETAIAASRQALVVWFFILLVFGVGGLILGQQELAMMVAVSGVVMAAHAADYHPRLTLLYQLVSITLIGTCASTLFGLAIYLRTSGGTGPGATVVPLFSLLAGVVMLSTAAPPVARALARVLFGARGESHSFRLAARLTLFGFLLAVPAWFAAQSLFERVQDIRQIFTHLTFGGAAFGYVILALASVGFLVRRDLRSTLERLGLVRPMPRDLLLVVIGVPILFAFNWAGEWGQRHWFAALWASDRRVNEALVGALSRPSMVALSLTAGIGEEITMRGALQPKLGLVLTSLFFAALHVQYSWYGMGMIFMFGVLLGVIRKRSSTVVAMAVHTIYDLLAMLST